MSHSERDREVQLTAALNKHEIAEVECSEMAAGHEYLNAELDPTGEATPPICVSLSQA